MYLLKDRSKVGEVLQRGFGFNSDLIDCGPCLLTGHYLSVQYCTIKVNLLSVYSVHTVLNITGADSHMMMIQGLSCRILHY